MDREIEVCFFLYFGLDYILFTDVLIRTLSTE